MITVRFKSSAFVGGQRFQSGIQEVTEHLQDRLPSSAVVISEADAARAFAEMAEREKAARDPKTLKEMRSGRAKARPMGKANIMPKDPAVILDDAKGYRLPPKTFKAAEGDAEVPFSDARDNAVSEYLKAGDANSVETWNQMKEADRKALIEASADALLKGK